MMEHISLDPYEQQLLSVFDSYDHDNCGSLDRDGLMQLCQTLQLEDQSADLITCLLKEPQHSRVTFGEFKDALLALLGTMQNDDTIIKKQENGSPDREVSPKFVYGSKKYGRRSRPRNDEIVEQNDLNLNKTASITVQRSNSQSEVSSKKRKTNYKLKRCTSLPGNHDFGGRKFHFNTNHLDEGEFLCTEEMLREAWKKLGVGEDGYLNQTELILVCDAIGLHKLAKGVIRQLSDKLVLDYDHRISFQELLEALQQDDTWSEVLDSTSINVDESLNVTHEIFPDSRTFQFVTLGPDGNGHINTETLIEMWETIGITSPKELIHELGFNNHQINIVELAKVLEKEMKGIQDGTRSDYHNPHITLLQANLVLYQSEIRCLKQILEQMHAEREKLKCDVSEANNRAKLLAQEVDDNHIRMERNTQNQVKLLEQRHADLLKDITYQFTIDKEQLNTINQNLEEKIVNLEQETLKLKNDLLVAQKYSTTIEKENQMLSSQISELHEIKNVLSEQIHCLENDKQKYAEMEHEQIEPLLAKLSVLQVENAQLRDKNDEMVTEIETLTCQVASMRVKVNNTPTYNTLDQSMEENVSYSDSIGLGAKRRSDYSPTKDNDLFGIVDGSPRLGKVRKFHRNQPEHLEVPFTSNESGFDTADCFDSSTSSTNDNEEIGRLRAKIAFLEQILIERNIPINTSSSDQPTVTQLKQRVEDLDNIIRNIKCEVNKMINKNGVNCDNLKWLSGHLDKMVNNERIDDNKVNNDRLDELVKKLEDENKDLITKCGELENCIELLKVEYEKCEDYWQSKLDDERQMFEQEQAQNTEKLSDLFNKMAEYEEQFANQDGRLPPIEETYNLEKQFTDLEQEFDEHKQYAENELFKKDEEITVLKQKLIEMEPPTIQFESSPAVDVGVQANDINERIADKLGNLSLCVVESTNLFSADAMPATNFVWNNGAGGDESQVQPSTSSSSTLEKNSTPCRPKRTRKHDRNNVLYKKNADNTKKTDLKNNDEQMVALPVSTIHNLNGRLHHLEQRCRQLQVVLKQQHFYTEQTLQQCWQHHRGEKAEMQCMLRTQQEKIDQQMRVNNDQLERLARSDMLVKDLYVENSYLIAKVQRLEQQCHFLAQCNSNSSSV